MSQPLTSPLVAVTCPVPHDRNVTCPSCRAEIIQPTAFGPSDADQLTELRRLYCLPGETAVQGVRRSLCLLDKANDELEADLNQARSELASALTAKADAERKLAAALKDAETVHEIGRETREERDRLRGLALLMWRRGRFDQELADLTDIVREAGYHGFPT